MREIEIVKQEQANYITWEKIESTFGSFVEKLNDLLNQVSKNISEENNEYRTFDSAEVQKMLGISKKTLVKYRTQGALNFRVINSKIFYTRRDIEEFFEKCKKTNNFL